MRIRVGGLVVALAAVALGCSGDDGDAEPSSPPTDVVTAVEVTTTVPETTAPTTTSAPTTSAAPTTTSAPTTTIDPAVALAEEVERDYREGWRRLRLAQQQPANRALRREALAYYTGASAKTVRETLASFEERGYRLLSEPRVKPVVVIEVRPVATSEQRDAVRLQACVIDPWVLVEAGGAPSGDDAVVDDLIYAYRNDVLLEKKNEVWATSESTEVGQWVGVETCPDS